MSENLDFSEKILVVDDGKENRDLLKIKLTAAGFQIETASTGKEALMKLEEINFDLVLLDILMPGIGGLEVLAEIRKKYKLNELPVLMVTAKTQTVNIVEAFDLGANDYVIKPLDFPVVLARTKTLLALKRTEQRTISALKKEKELADLRSRFLATASHEFRTPLTVIMAASDILKRYSNRMEDDEKTQNLTTIQQQVRVLIDILDEFMIMSEEEKVDLKLEEFDIESFCNQIVDEVLTTSNSNHIIAVNNWLDKTVGKFDKKLLRQILTNLLLNAIKYSPGKTNIDLDLFEDKNMTQFQVRDYGIGIPGDELERLYAPFVRASNIGDTPGMGLGLSIVKKSVDNYNGEITCESVLGEGTTFSVTIPNQKYFEKLYEKNISD